MALGYPGGINTYVPTLDLSGSLMVSHSRNIKNIPLNKYITYTSVKLPRGEYLRFNPLDQGRVRAAPYGSRWASGNLRPTGFHNTMGFQSQTFNANRYNFSVTLDKLAVDVGNWPVQKTHSEMLAQEAMTERAYQVGRVISSSSTYDATHVKTANALAGGFLDGGTTADPRILKAFSEAAAIIQKDTMGRIRQGELSAIFNDNTARKLARTRELREFVMQMPGARDLITGKGDKSYTGRYMLPPELYDFGTVVEDTYYNPSNRGASAETGVNVFPDNTILVMARPGDLDAAEGAASYSTCHLFIYEDMTVEAHDDPRHRLLYLDIVDHYAVEVVSPVSAVLITNVFS